VRLLLIVLLYFVSIQLAPAQVSILPFQHNSNLNLERKIYEYQIVKHPSVQQWVVQFPDDTLREMDHERWQKRRYEKWLGRKLWNEDLFSVDTSNFTLKINPLVNFQIGSDAADSSNQTLSTNSRGILIEGTLGKKFGFYTSAWENQSFFPTYLSNYINSTGAVPGQGRVKPFKQSGFDYARSSAVMYYQPANWLSIQAGHGKNFYGNGYRSILLSDFAFNYPYLKVGFSMFGAKLLYQPSIASLQELIRLPATGATEAQFQRKAGTFHVLNFQPNSKLEIGLFEGGVWQNWDTTGTVKLPANFYAPIIFMNSGINGLQSDNYKGIVGLNVRLNPFRKLALYSQLALSEDNVNKLGSQFGAKWFDAFKIENLFLQAEFNTIENGLYSNSNSGFNYSHYNEGLGNLSLQGTQEIIARVNFSWHDIFFRFKYNNQKRTVAVNSTSGAVVVVSNVVQNVSIAAVELGYLMNASNNRMILIGMQQRNSEIPLRTDESQWFYLAFRTELQNLYFDF